jgi:hypothetical protein
MTRFLIGRPELVEPALLDRYPELRAPRYRRGGLPPRVAGWCLGRGSVSAITLWSTIWLGDSADATAELLLHESRHVAQFEASKLFPIHYLWESLRRGYWNNRYEVDARDYARRRAGAGPPPTPG